jgi:hypothetical protein
MSKLVELTRYDSYERSTGKALINPDAVTAILEVTPHRGIESRCRIKLLDGEWIDIYEDPMTARTRLGI